jgi:hypothetical protein
MLNIDKLKLAMIYGLANAEKYINYSDDKKTIEHLREILKDIRNESKPDKSAKGNEHSIPND